MIEFSFSCKFKIASIVSLAEGTVFSNDQLTQNVQTITSSVRATGYYTACALGLRFECIRRFFFELKQTGGFIAKTNVNLRTQQAEKLTLDKWFTDTQVKIGIFMFINTLDKCGTCPKWWILRSILKNIKLDIKMSIKKLATCKIKP